MPWGRLDDSLYDHPKLDLLGRNRLPGLGLHTLAISWSNRWLTDGNVPAERVRRLGGSIALADQLVAAGLWERTEGGYLVHDFLEYNQSREAVLADREVSRRRSAMNANPELSRTVRTRDQDQCRYCGKRVNWRDRKSDDGGTYDHVIPVAAGGDESPANLVVACRSCNGRKGARTPDESGMLLRPVPGQKPSRSRRDSGVKNLDPRPDPSRPVPNPVRREVLLGFPRPDTGSIGQGNHFDHDDGAPRLTDQQLAAWGPFEGTPAWGPFRAAWLARGFVLPPRTAQRAVLWPLVDARPNDVGRWVAEAPAGSTGYEVVNHVLARFAELRSGLSS